MHCWCCKPSACTFCDNEYAMAAPDFGIVEVVNPLMHLEGAGVLVEGAERVGTLIRSCTHGHTYPCFLRVQAQQQAKSADFQADFYEITQQLEALKSKLEGASSGAPAAPAAPAPKTEVNSLGEQLRERVPGDQGTT